MTRDDVIQFFLFYEPLGIAMLAVVAALIFEWLNKV